MSINSFMANDRNVGVGSTGTTTPPDVARYEEMKAAKSAGNVGVGSTATNVGVGSTATNVGVGSTATTETEPDTAVDGGQSAPTATNVGVGSTATTKTQSLCPPDDDNVGIGSS